MPDQIRRPFFLVALCAWVLVVLVELGSGLLLPVASLSEAQLLAAMTSDNSDPPSPADLRSMVRARNEKPPRPGYAISSLAAFDGLALLGLFWMEQRW